jgi:hypothetical protein
MIEQLLIISVSGEAALAAVTLLQASLQYSRSEDVMILFTNTNETFGIKNFLRNFYSNLL